MGCRGVSGEDIFEAQHIADGGSLKDIEQDALGGQLGEEKLRARPARKS